MLSKFVNSQTQNFVWVDLSEIAAIEEGRQGTLLFLKSGRAVTVDDSVETVLKEYDKRNN